MAAKEKRKTFVIDLDVSTGAYSAGDAVGTLQTLDDAVEQANQSGMIEEIVVLDQDNQSAALELVFFERAPAASTDNAAYVLSAADMNKVIGRVPVVAGDYATVASRAIAQINPELAFQIQQGFALLLQVVTPGTPTYASDALRLKITVIQD